MFCIPLDSSDSFVDDGYPIWFPPGDNFYAKTTISISTDHSTFSLGHGKIKISVKILTTHWNISMHLVWKKSASGLVTWRWGNIDDICDNNLFITLFILCNYCKCWKFWCFNKSITKMIFEWIVNCMIK